MDLHRFSTALIIIAIVLGLGAVGLVLANKLPDTERQTEKQRLQDRLLRLGLDGRERERLDAIYAAEKGVPERVPQLLWAAGGCAALAFALHFSAKPKQD
jgi:hypothetical protein